MMKKNLFYLSILFLFITSCDNYEEAVSVDNGEQIKPGTGLYNFSYQATNRTVSMSVYYHVPDANLKTMPILFVFHGAGRNAVEYRNNWIDKANDKEFIVLAPKFSSSEFPGGDGYNLGNVFEDGDNPTLSSLNNELDWAFSVVEPLFDEVKSQLENTSSTYNIFGFSAGAQFVHRFLMFKPNARVNKVVASAAGWYTLPDATLEFPYGIVNSPIEDIPASHYFSKNMTIQIGTLDNDPNANALRRNPIVDQQGSNRYDRAFYMFNTSKSIAKSIGEDFNWEIVETPENDHDNRGAVEQASEIVFYKP